MSKGNKFRQICCRLLSLFESAANAAHFVGRMAKGMVSSLCRLRMKARRLREIRLGRMFDGCSAHIYGAVAWGRAHESEVRLWVAVWRVKVVPPCFPSAST